MQNQRTILRVYPQKQLRKTVPGIIGINVNFLTDHATQRVAGQGFEQALRELGVRSLRYPGGEKSDEFFWSTPPWDSPRPSLALTGPKGRLSSVSAYVEDYSRFRCPPLDFDQFIEICQDLDAEPVICVNFDSMYLPRVSEKGTAPTKDQLLENAVQWVYYANKTRDYRVKYWELGNESYLLGHNGAATADNYARDFSEFSRAMKEIDPTIQIGANGHVRKDARGKADGEDGPIWWKTILEAAAGDIDFLVVHPYPCWMWGSYYHYIHHNPNFTEAVDEAQAALDDWAPEHRERIRVLVTETNAADWAGSEHFPGLKGWPLVNDLGHALVLFEILGQHLLHPKVDLAQVWNTRWVHPDEKSLWNTLDENNQFNATAHAIAIWGKNLLDDMVAVDSTDLIRAFATRSSADRSLTVLLINKSLDNQAVRLDLLEWPFQSATAWNLFGEGPEDQLPVYQPAEGLQPLKNGMEVLLKPVSLTTIHFS